MDNTWNVTEKPQHVNQTDDALWPSLETTTSQPNQPTSNQDVNNGNGDDNGDSEYGSSEDDSSDS